MIKYGEFITPEEYMELRKMVGWVEFPIEQVKTPMQGGSADVMTDSCPSDIMGGKPNILWR
ncbi:MAG: hypothetical protein IKP88_04265 [Lachnospiraceae bacterium]|nr:hypothetical protein [Lachnospiraceae bacterium]